MKSETMEANITALQIDIKSLGTECAKQAASFAKVGLSHIEAFANLKRHKAKLELHKAVLSEHIRQNPVEFGIPKVTETAIQNATIASTITQDLQKGLDELEKEVSEKAVLREAWVQRAGMLESEVAIYQSTKEWL